MRNEAPTSCEKKCRNEIDSIRSDFENDGFVCIKDILRRSNKDSSIPGSGDGTKIKVLTDADMKSLLYVARSSLKECWKVLHKNGYISVPHEKCQGDYSMKRGVKHGFREIVMRHPGRYEVAYFTSYLDESLQYDLSCVIKSIQYIFEPIISHIFYEEDFYLCNLSVVTATTGAVEQQWHCDGGHVNENPNRTDQSKGSSSKGDIFHLPCHCLNIFLPLVDLNENNGPTEIRPGSHKLTRNLAAQMLIAKARKTLRKPIAPKLDVGDALLFDYRVLHRGLVNLSDDRPILVLTYAKCWFKDSVNFPTRSIFDKKKN